MAQYSVDAGQKNAHYNYNYNHYNDAGQKKKSSNYPFDGWGHPNETDIMS